MDDASVLLLVLFGAFVAARAAYVILTSPMGVRALLSMLIAIGVWAWFIRAMVRGKAVEKQRQKENARIGT